MPSSIIGSKGPAALVKSPPIPPTSPIRRLDDTKISIAENVYVIPLQNNELKPTRSSPVPHDMATSAESPREFFELSRAPSRQLSEENVHNSDVSKRRSYFTETANLSGGHIFSQLRQKSLIVGSDSSMNPIPETGPSSNVIGSLKPWQWGVVRMIGGYAPELPAMTDGEKTVEKIKEEFPQVAASGAKKHRRRKILPWIKQEGSTAILAAVDDRSRPKNAQSPIAKVEE